MATNQVIFDIIREQVLKTFINAVHKNPEVANMKIWGHLDTIGLRNRSFRNMTFACHNIIIVTVSISPTGLRYWINQRPKKAYWVTIVLSKDLTTCLISHTDLDESQFWKDACHAWRQARNETNFKLQN